MRISNKDWAQREELVTKNGQTVSSGLAAIPNPYTAGATIVLPLAIGVVGEIMNMDKDDELGQHLHKFPMWSLPFGNHTQFWNFNGGGWWYSNWMYTVQYRVIKG